MNSATPSADVKTLGFGGVYDQSLSFFGGQLHVAMKPFAAAEISIEVAPFGRRARFSLLRDGLAVGARSAPRMPES